MENTYKLTIDEKYEVKQIDTVQDGIEIFEVPKDKLIEFVTFLKIHINTRFDMLLAVSGADKPDYYEVIYHIYSTIFNKKIILKVKLNKENPCLETLSKIYSAADWHERETYDLFGIKFDNHSNLERILLPKDWIGHPLRKNYVNNDDRLSWNKR